MYTSGSSPLARGTRISNDRRRTRRTVHPRSRGEHTERDLDKASRTGSSPLARGTRLVAVHRIAGRRFIPARAGNTVRAAFRQPLASVHPRSRGEHAHRAAPDERRVGSSPLARGTRTRSAVAKVNAFGSSPLARGTLLRHRRPLRRGRFIPARAGNTVAQFKYHWQAAGSSPLARGTRLPADQPVKRLRFIPARAGNTSKVKRHACTATVHPRSRGEHLLRDMFAAITGGSSPLARGTP